MGISLNSILSDKFKIKNTDGGTRTRDSEVKSLMLYQLSYAGVQFILTTVHSIFDVKLDLQSQMLSISSSSPAAAARPSLRILTRDLIAASCSFFLRSALLPPNWSSFSSEATSSDRSKMSSLLTTSPMGKISAGRMPALSNSVTSSSSRSMQAMIS